LRGVDGQWTFSRFDQGRNAVRVITMLVR
jgi:hypothetical protein